MKNWMSVVPGASFPGGAASFHAPPGWEPLLDESLCKWQTHESCRHRLGHRGQQPTNAQGQPLAPISTKKRTDFYPPPQA